MAGKWVSDDNLEYFKGKQDAQNESTFAKSANVPTAVSDLTNDSGFQTQEQVQNAIDSAVSSMYTVKGSTTRANLPSNPEVGDVYNLTDEGGMNVVWNGTEWDNLGSTTELDWDAIQGKPSTFIPSTHTHTRSQITDFPSSLPASDVASWAKQPSKPTYSYSEVGAAAANHTHSAMTGASTSSAGVAGFVPAPSAGANTRFLRSDGTWVTPTGTTYGLATQSNPGLMSAADKTKLDGLQSMQAMTTQEIDALFD